MPPFASNVAPTSGTLGGVGFRAGSCRLVVLPTDIGAVAPFLGAIPATVTGLGGSVPAAQFASSSTTPGDERFGFSSDAKTSAANTVAGAVAPLGSATVQETIAALNALGIRVIGLTNQSDGPPDQPVPASTGPDYTGISMLQAIAKLTGAVDATGTPLVYPIDASDTSGLRTAIATAIGTALATENDVTLVPTFASSCLGVPGITPTVVTGVGGGESATFRVEVSPCTPASAVFEFRDVTSGTTLATASLVWKGPCAPFLSEGTSSGVELDPDDAPPPKGE